MKLLSEHLFLQGPLVIRKYLLSNGLKLILLRDPSAPVVAYQTWFQVGSRHERMGKTGIAHLFEHLMFNETENLAPGEFDRQIEMHGGHTNASTWVDWTYYQTDIPASQLKHVIQLESDRMAHLVLHSKQLESERDVVMNERRFRVEDDVAGFLSEELFKLAFVSHPYHWPTIGFMEDIQAITLEDAQQFYRTYYAPNNATLVVVGDFSESQTLQWIEESYGKFASQKIPKESLIVEPPQTAERKALYQKPVTTENIIMGYKGPALNQPTHLSLQMLGDVLLGGPSSRLYRDLVVEKEIASSANAFVTPFRDPGLFQLQIVLQRGRGYAEAEQCIEEHIQSLATQGPSLEELDRTKARVMTEFFTSLRTMRGKAEALGEYEIQSGDCQQLFRLVAQMHALQPVDLQHVAQTFLASAQKTIVVAQPV